MSKLLIIIFLLASFSLPVLAELNLTKPERKWIQENPVVKFTGDPNWLPYEAFDDEGNYIGIVAEHLKIISEHSGLTFKMSPSKTWTESVNKARSGEVDVLSETDDSDLKSHLDFTIPYISNPIVMVMRNSENYVESINVIKDRKIALIKDYGYASKIRRKHLDINFITVNDIHDGLISVSTGKVDTLLCTLALCSYTISELGLNNVKIIGKSEFDTKLALGVQKNLPLLLSILNKSIKTISQEQQQIILNRWIKGKFVHKTDYSLVIKVVIVSLIILFIFIFWNRRLSNEINLRIGIEDKLKHEKDFSTSIVNTAPVIVLLLDPEGYIEYVNPYFEKLSGFQLDEIKGKEWITTFLPERDQKKIRKLLQSAVEKKPVRGNVNSIVIRSGEEREIEWYAETMHDEHGNTSRVLSIGQDVTENKQAERALLKSEAGLNEAQRLAKVGSWELDLVTAHLVWSDEIYRIFEIDKEQFDASYESFLNMIHPEDRDRVNKAYSDSLSDRLPYEIKHRLLMKDGRNKYVIEACKTFFDDNGKPLRSVGTVQDITKEMLIDIELEQSNLRFKAMFESIPDAIVYADPERKIHMVNTATIELFGFDDVEMHGNQTKMLYASHDDFKQQGVKRFNPDSKKQNTTNIITYKKKDGNEFPGETFGSTVKTSSGEVLGYLGIIRDVSDREHVDAILRSLAAGTSEMNFNAFMNDVLERLTKLYDCKYAFIGQLQADSKHIKTLAVRVNGNIADNFEYHLDGTPCKDILDVKSEIIPKDACILYPNDQMLVDMEIDSYYGAPLISSDGKVFGILSVMDTKEMILDEWSEPVLGVFAKRVSLEMERDVAIQKLQNNQESLEEQVKIRTIDLVTARNEAERANEAKSDFLSSMSHELRTPLNAILGFGQMLEINNSGLSNVQQSNVKEILEAGQHLLNLINEVLNLAQIESGKTEIKMEKIDLTELLQDCINLMKTSIENMKVEVIDNISEQHYFVKADYMRLKQILLNLISNAIKYNKESGRLIFDSEIVNKQRIQIRVTDNGTGLTEDDVEKLFNPFERLNAKDNIEGTGIGLTITKHLSELMGGSIGVESTSGVGSTFWVEFDLFQD